MPTNTMRSLLQLPFDTFYTNANAIDSFFPVSLILLCCEAILLGIAIVQLFRFAFLPNIYLKKIIHVLIAFQLIGMFARGTKGGKGEGREQENIRRERLKFVIGSITQLIDMSKFLGIDYQPFILFSVQEAAFVFSGLAYFTVLLFWYVRPV
jgi:hypothetical protein